MGLQVLTTLEATKIRVVLYKLDVFRRLGRTRGNWGRGRDPDDRSRSSIDMPSLGVVATASSTRPAGMEFHGSIICQLDFPSGLEWDCTPEDLESRPYIPISTSSRVHQCKYEPDADSTPALRIIARTFCWPLTSGDSRTEQPLYLQAE